MQTPGGEKYEHVSPPGFHEANFSAVFFCITRDGLSDRGTTHGLFGSEAFSSQLFIGSNTGSDMLIWHEGMNGICMTSRIFHGYQENQISEP